MLGFGIGDGERSWFRETGVMPSESLGGARSGVRSRGRNRGRSKSGEIVRNQSVKDTKQSENETFRFPISRQVWSYVL